MYEVTDYIDKKEDVEVFLMRTSKFKHKFYSYENCYENMPTPTSYIRIVAIAKSRDITYIIKWRMDSRKYLNNEEFRALRDEYYARYGDGKYPRNNEVPKKEWEHNMLFSPKVELDEALNTDFNILFDLYDFKRVATIRRNDRDLSGDL